MPRIRSVCHWFETWLFSWSKGTNEFCYSISWRKRHLWINSKVIWRSEVKILLGLNNFYLFEMLLIKILGNWRFMNSNATASEGFEQFLWTQIGSLKNTILCIFIIPMAWLLLYVCLIYKGSAQLNEYTKEIEIIHKLFLVIPMYCQASSMNH